MSRPRYPVYIISKGRADTSWTAMALARMDVVPFFVVVEPQEAEEYALKLPAARLLVLPFSNLGQGSIPVRNWVWEHAEQLGSRRHWILDDNIKDFFRFTGNRFYKARSGAVFRAAEDFVDRYQNVRMAGFQYFMFVLRRDKISPFIPNTRIYSCILLDTALKLPDGERWRGRYNEDTDISLRVLKSGECTILFNAFLAEKMTMKGGNSDELYQGDGRLQMAQALQAQHPDVVKVGRRWGRWQHVVNYRPFRGNRLILRDDYEPLSEPDDYGMRLSPLPDLDG